MKMKIPGQKIVTGAVAGAALGACVACETIPEEAFEPDEATLIALKAEIDKTGENLETIKLLAEVANPLPDINGNKDSKAFVSDVEDAHNKLVDMFKDGDILVMYQSDYSHSSTPEGASVNGIFIGGYTSNENDDTIVAFMDPWGKLILDGPGLEHEAGHGLSGENTHHSSEMVEAMTINDKPAQAKAALETDDHLYTSTMVQKTLYDLTEFVANKETEKIKLAIEEVDNDYPIEWAKEAYQNGIELRDLPKDDWAHEMAAWFYHHEFEVPVHPDYPLEYNQAANFSDYVVGLGITEDEMRYVLTESDIYERRQDVLNEAMQELTESYGEKVRESDETKIRPESEGEIKTRRL